MIAKYNDINLIAYLFLLMANGYLVLILSWIWREKGNLRTEYRYVLGMAIGMFINFISAIKLRIAYLNQIPEQEYLDMLSSFSWTSRSLPLLFILIVVVWHLRKESRTKRRCSDWNGEDRRISKWNGELRRGDDVVENGI